jgi:ABC-2 type transport system ATP-binding protein
VTSDPALVDDATVEVTDLSKWFGQKVAVSGVTCSFGPGLTGLLGPNGAGKTTLLRTITGLIQPSDGTVTVLGTKPRSDPGVYKDVGLVPEDDAVYGSLTATQYVEYAAKLSGVASPEAAAKRVLTEVALTADAGRPISAFSKGMRQRAKVAAGLVHDPKILVLDEPLNGTDPVQRAALIQLFQRLAGEGRTVIVSSHVLQEVERMTERVIAMVDGRLAAAGHIGAIRRSMTDIPYRVAIEASDLRALAQVIMADDGVEGVTLDGKKLHVETTDLPSLGVLVPTICRDHGIRLTSFRPEDESLESVFRYLVRRR